MEVFTRTELRLRQQEIIAKIKAGSLFIHPTDTIYGIGCNALLSSSVQKIRTLKERPTTPFSIWVPSLQWIQDNCILSPEGNEWLKKLPGPYTLILPLKDKNIVTSNLAPGLNAIGIRYPDHWFSKIVEAVGVPIVTTSANKHGKPFMTSLVNLDTEIEQGVEFMIYEGPKEGKPSKIIDLVEGKIKER